MLDSGHNHKPSRSPSPSHHADRKYNMEFCDHSDDAWYTVRVINEGGETLRVNFDCFPDSSDKVFYIGDENENLKKSVNRENLKSVDELEDLEERFRPVSTQLQDKDCDKVVRGLVVCAAYSDGDADLRFYDAVVDDVLRNKHSFTDGEEVCMCKFLVYWKHGPGAGNLVEKKVENICVVQDFVECDDLALYSFLKLAREKIVDAPSMPSLYTKANLSGCNDRKLHEVSSPTIMGKLTSEPRMIKRFKSARQSVPSKGIVSETIRQDTDIGGFNVCYTVFVENVEKDLSSSTIMKFINKQTGITSEVYIFPSLSSETFARCAITLDSVKKLEIVYGLLDNPNHIVTSSKGKPWVVVEKKSERKIFRSPIRTFMLSYQINFSGDVDKLKIVRSGTEEYDKVKKLKDFFMHFVDRKQQFIKRLASMEEDILQSSKSA